jgi:capsular polysaccharide biosynthesis protein
VLLGLLGGLAIGMLAAVVAEQRDRSVRGPEDLADVLPVPLLATLPLVRLRRPGKSRIVRAL